MSSWHRVNAQTAGHMQSRCNSWQCMKYATNLVEQGLANQPDAALCCYLEYSSMCIAEAATAATALTEKQGAIALSVCTEDPSFSLSSAVYLQESVHRRCFRAIDVNFVHQHAIEAFLPGKPLDFFIGARLLGQKLITAHPGVSKSLTQAFYLVLWQSMGVYVLTRGSATLAT